MILQGLLPVDKQQEIMREILKAAAKSKMVIMNGNDSP